MEDVDISDLMGKGLVMAVCMGDKKQAYKIIHKVARRNSEEVLLGICNGLHDLLSDLDKIDPEFRIELKNLCKMYRLGGCDCGHCRSAGP